MNIFYFTRNVDLNSKILDDKRVVKMILETTQLLSNSLYLNNKKNPYKPTHLKHPCTIWANESRANWLWLKKYGLSLCKEYTKRFHKKHKCEKIIRKMQCPPIKNKGFIQPYQCMPEKYKCKKSSKAYMCYYVGEKLNPNYFKRCDKKIYEFWKKIKNKLLTQ